MIFWMIILIVSIIIIGLLIKYTDLFSFDNLKRKTDILLAVIIFGGIFLFDIAMNKATDIGLTYEVTLWAGKTILATGVMWIGGLMSFIALCLLIANDMFNKQGMAKLDFLVGCFGFFGFTLEMIGGILQIFHIEKMPFFFWEMFTINFYHLIALPIMGITIIYFILAE